MILFAEKSLKKRKRRKKPALLKTDPVFWYHGPARWNTCCGPGDQECSSRCNKDSTDEMWHVPALSININFIGKLFFCISQILSQVYFPLWLQKQVNYTKHLNFFSLCKQFNTKVQFINNKKMSTVSYTEFISISCVRCLKGKMSVDPRMRIEFPHWPGNNLSAFSYRSKNSCHII